MGLDQYDKPVDEAKYVTIIDNKVIALIPEFQGEQL
jgi:hypothetical protein